MPSVTLCVVNNSVSPGMPFSEFHVHISKSWSEFLSGAQIASSNSTSENLAFFPREPFFLSYFLFWLITAPFNILFHPVVLTGNWGPPWCLLYHYIEFLIKIASFYSFFLFLYSCCQCLDVGLHCLLSQMLPYPPFSLIFLSSIPPMLHIVLGAVFPKHKLDHVTPPVSTLPPIFYKPRSPDSVQIWYPFAPIKPLSVLWALSPLGLGSVLSAWNVLVLSSLNGPPTQHSKPA